MNNDNETKAEAPTQPRKVNPTVVTMLKEWLVDAESGELTDVKLSGVYYHGSPRREDSRTVSYRHKPE